MTRTKANHNIFHYRQLFTAQMIVCTDKSSLTCHLLFEMRNFRCSIPSCCEHWNNNTNYYSRRAQLISWFNSGHTLVGLQKAVFRLYLRTRKIKLYNCNYSLKFEIAFLVQVLMSHINSSLKKLSQ
jgi:hypothetical protein